MSDRDLWYGTSGPRDAKIVIVGESWGAEELAAKRPFVGSSGQELNRMLSHAGINRADVLCTNVIAEKPDGNETYRFFHPKNGSDASKRVGGLIPSDLVASEVGRLYRQLAYAQRAVVIAAGNWSLWSLSRHTGAEVGREASGRKIPIDLQTFVPTGITLWRGSMTYVEPHPEFFLPNFDPSGIRHIKLLPLIHPAAILRQ